MNFLLLSLVINMLSKEDILGVMVTYNPDCSVVKNVKSLIEQVSYVLIIDNGSDKEMLKYLCNIRKNNKIGIISNKTNMGIAYALNQGLSEAVKRSFKLILTMDQDSNLSQGCVDKMLKALNENSSLISVGPNYNCKVRKSKKEYLVVDSLITSGNLTYTNVAMSIGGYSSDLFIDSVDFDFSLSLRRTQGKLAVVSDAMMSHKLGEKLEKKILNIPIRLSIHSPLRHYYMYRNHYFIMRKFGLVFTKFCIKKEIIMWKYFLEVILLHPDRLKNIRMILKGVKHAIENKYGKYPA